MIKVGFNPELDSVFFPLISIVILNVPVFDISFRFVKGLKGEPILCDASMTIFGFYIENCRCEELAEKGIDVVSGGHYQFSHQDEDETGDDEKWTDEN